MSAVWGAQRLYFSRKEVALLLNLSERSVDYLVSNNRIHSIKAGRRRLIHRESLLNFAGAELRERMQR